MEEYKVVFFDRNNIIICSHIVECQNASKALQWARRTQQVNKQVGSFRMWPLAEFNSMYGRKR